MEKSILLIMIALMGSYNVALSTNFRPMIFPSSKKEFHWNHKCGETFYQPKFGRHRNNKRIIGGEDSIRHSWPFLASIRIDFGAESSIKSSHHCGGTIISNKHILTAAHCILIFMKIAKYKQYTFFEMKNLIKIHLGSHANEVEEKNVYGIETLDFHENFNFTRWTINNDLMILTLDREIVFNDPDINIACLPDQSNDNLHGGAKIIGIGWGVFTSSFVRKYPTHIQQAEFEILDSSDPKCNSGMIGKINWDSDHNVCASGLNMVTCFGDSGGPVMQQHGRKWTVIGIISFANDIKDESNSRQKCDPSMPFYFVNIRKYMNWINTRIE